MSRLRQALRFPVRAVRHLVSERSYSRYYSGEGWEQTWRDDTPDFSGANEDVHYGAMMQILRRYDRGPMLDLGCGDGLLWDYYRPLSNSTLWGVDYAPSAVAKAASRGIPNSAFECRDFQTWEPGLRFSVVVFNESVYYIDDIGAALRRAQSWLAPGGVVLLCMMDTLVTRRVWKDIRAGQRVVQAARVCDLGTGRSRTIRVLTPSAEPHR